MAIAIGHDRGFSAAIGVKLMGLSNRRAVERVCANSLHNNVFALSLGRVWLGRVRARQAA